MIGRYQREGGSHRNLTNDSTRWALCLFYDSEALADNDGYQLAVLNSF